MKTKQVPVAKQAKIYKVLQAPHISEKAANIAEKVRQYTFKVMQDATKPEIKAAVEQLFNVKVLGVQVVNVKGKQKIFKQRLGRRKNWKKAYVSLQEGFEINFVGQE